MCPAGFVYLMLHSPSKKVGAITQTKVDGLDTMRASTSAKRFINSLPEDVKPSEDDPVRALVLTGDDLETLGPEDWNTVVGNYTEIVFARTTPEQKLTIVEQIKARGDNTVAVTGDGVNDAPALKASDIGIAMGAGSDVAKEAGKVHRYISLDINGFVAAMILVNNDFASITVAIEMGRLVFDNLKKVILYLMPVSVFPWCISLILIR